MRLTGGPAIERSTAEPGVAVAACGVTPALRIRMWTSAACAAVCTVTTDQHAIVTVGQGRDNLHPVGRRDGKKMMDDLGRQGGIADRVPRRPGQETPREDVHGAIEGRRG